MKVQIEPIPIMKIIDCIQNSDEWFGIRLGKVTASSFAKATAGGQGKTRLDYMDELLSQRMTGKIEDGYTNHFMEWGSEHEDQAAACYELETGTKLEKVGFCELNENVGCSPDRVIFKAKMIVGLVQIKCPSSKIHVKYLRENKAPSNYMKQIQGEMWVTGAEWSDFVSYDPRNIKRDFFCVRVMRDDAFIKKLSDGIFLFVNEMLELERQLVKGN